MARAFSPRGLSKHLNYRVDDVSRVLGCSKATVRNWIKSGKLGAMTDRKPYLLRGADLIAFLKERKSSRKKCALDECYCVKCRDPRRLISGEGHIALSKGAKPQLRGPCEDCGTLLLKPIKRTDAAALAALLAESFRRAG
jgi:excisionase family DNA binding protein